MSQTTDREDSVALPRRNRFGVLFAAVWMVFLGGPLIEGWNLRDELRGWTGILATIAFSALYLYTLRHNAAAASNDDDSADDSRSCTGSVRLDRVGRCDDRERRADRFGSSTVPRGDSGDAVADRRRRHSRFGVRGLRGDSQPLVRMGKLLRTLTRSLRGRVRDLGNHVPDQPQLRHTP